VRQKTSTPVTIYEPNQRARIGFFASWVFMFRNLIRSRDLIGQLFKRDLFSIYKQSFFGIFWIVISPLIGIISWVFMNYTGILNPGDVGVPYPVYILLGTSLWGLFMSFYAASSGSLSSSGSLIVQVNFPHEALVAQQLAQTVTSLIANMVTLCIVLAIFGISPSWKALFFPLAILPLFLLGSGMGMVVAVLVVVVHDVSKIVTSALGLLMFLTPVIYAPKFQNDILQAIISWNPLTYLIGGARDIVLHGRISHPFEYICATLLSIAVFLLSWRFFFLSEQKVAEKF